MAKNVFNPETNYSIKLLGHLFDGYTGGYADVHGHFEADTVEVSNEAGGEREYAVFVVDDPVNGEYPFAFVGSYRIGMSLLKMNYNHLLFPEPEADPEPEPEADPVDPSDPADPADPSDPDNADPVE